MDAITDTSNSRPWSVGDAPSDGERALVHCLFQAAVAAGVRTDPLSIVNFYVALKSRPRAVLAGPAQTGKIALVQSLAHVLAGDDPMRCQMMMGHARWAARSQNVAEFVEAQARFNTAKLSALVEEAGQAENASRVYIACLTHISPAELLSLFSAATGQYPPNLLLIGTMDSAHFQWWDADLLSQTTVIHWPGVRQAPTPAWQPAPAELGDAGEFLRSCVRSEQAAYAKLSRLLRDQPQALWPLFQVEQALKQYAVRFPPLAMREAMIYLANTWTRAEIGLFDCSSAGNLNMALDFGLVQHVLPWGEAELHRSAELRREVRQALGGRFSRAETFLEIMTGHTPFGASQRRQYQHHRSVYAEESGGSK